MRMPKKLEGLAPRRKAAGMTQAQLAESIGVERAALAMWEIGASWPSARILPALADVLLCTVDELYWAPEETAEGRPLPALRKRTTGGAGPASGDTSSGPFGATFPSRGRQDGPSRMPAPTTSILSADTPPFLPPPEKLHKLRCRQIGYR